MSEENVELQELVIPLEYYFEDVLVYIPSRKRDDMPYIEQLPLSKALVIAHKNKSAIILRDKSHLSP